RRDAPARALRLATVPAAGRRSDRARAARPRRSHRRGRRRRHAARAARARRPAPGERVPHGHLPDLQGQEDARQRSETGHRRRLRRARPGHPAVHLGGTLRSRAEPVVTPFARGTTMTTQSKHLTRDEADAFGRELDALRNEVLATLGQRDVDHLRAVIRLQRRAEAAGRLLLHFGIGPVSFVAGAGGLGLAKILENMEIGHNVMHGQYDWTRDPALAGQAYEWDTVCTGDDWRH